MRLPSATKRSVRSQDSAIAILCALIGRTHTLGNGWFAVRTLEEGQLSSQTCQPLSTTTALESRAGVGGLRCYFRCCCCRHRSRRLELKSVNRAKILRSTQGQQVYLASVRRLRKRVTYTFRRCLATSTSCSGNTILNIFLLSSNDGYHQHLGIISSSRQRPS